MGVMLMQCPRHPFAKRKSVKEAEGIADGARMGALKIQLSRAILSATRALDYEDKHAARRQREQRRYEAKQEREAARIQMAAMSRRRTNKMQQEKRKALQGLWRRSDLTMDDIMHGVASGNAG